MGTGIPDAADITASLPIVSRPTQSITMGDIPPAADAEFPLYEFLPTPRPGDTPAPPDTPHGAPGISRSATLGTRALSGRGGKVPERAKSMRVTGRTVPVE